MCIRDSTLATSAKPKHRISGKQPIYRGSADECRDTTPLTNGNNNTPANHGSAVPLKASMWDVKQAILKRPAAGSTTATGAKRPRTQTKETQSKVTQKEAAQNKEARPKKARPRCRAKRATKPTYKKPAKWLKERPNGCTKCRGTPGCTISCRKANTTPW